MASNYVILGNVLNSSGVPPVQVSGPAPTAGMVIAATDATDAVWSDVGAGTITLNGDVTGAGNANHVISITGGAGTVNVASTGNVITWAAATTAPGLAQAMAGSDIATQNLTIQSQAPYPGAVTNILPGNIVANLPSPISGATFGKFQVKNNGGVAASLGCVNNTGQYALWLGASPGSTNPTTVSDGSSFTYLNAPGAGSTLGFRLGATQYMSLTSTVLSSSVPIQLKTVIFNDGYSGAVTTDNGTYTIYTDTAIPASTMYDYVVTVVGLDSTDGYAYRADFSFTYQRIASAAPAVVGASPVPLNVRASTGAASWGGGSIALSTNSVIVQVTGIASTTIDWNCSVNRIKVA